MGIYLGQTSIPGIRLHVTSGTGAGNYQTKTVTPSTSSQTITADSNYDALSSVTVNAILTETKSVNPSNTSVIVTPSNGKYLTSVTVNPIPNTYIVPSGSLNITANGNNIDVTQYATVNVNVSGGSSATFSTQNKTVNPSTSIQTITADNGYDGLGTVTVNAMPEGTAGTPTATKGTVNNYSISITPSVTNITGYITGSTKTGTAITVSASELVSGTLNISSNGTQDVTNYKYVNVSVSSGGGTFSVQDKSINPTESQQVITPDSGYDGLSSVTIGAISSTYIGSGIVQRSSTDLTVSGATITAPAGYYSSAASKSVAAMTLPTATSTSYSGTSAMSAIGRSTSTRYINIPVGYNSTAKYYTISAVANGTVTAPSTISGTTATVSTGTNTLTLTKTVSVTPNVTTAGYISTGTAGNSSVSLTANITTKAATTYNVSTSNQTITAGTYLTGAQTIRAVTTSNLIAANIKAGTVVQVGDAGSAGRIANITGTFTSDATAAAADIVSSKTAYVNGVKITGELTFITYYTGSSAPSSSLGNNGDIYLMS